MDEMDMSMAAAMSDPVDEYDAMSGVPDDSFFGAQDLDPANVPQPRPATLPAVNLRPGVALQPPISGIAAPKLAGDVDWISPLSKESAKVTHLLRRATFGATDAEPERERVSKAKQHGGDDGTDVGADHDFHGATERDGRADHGRRRADRERERA